MTVSSERDFNEKYPKSANEADKCFPSGLRRIRAVETSDRSEEKEVKEEIASSSSSKFRCPAARFPSSSLTLTAIHKQFNMSGKLATGALLSYPLRQARSVRVASLPQLQETLLPSVSVGRTRKEGGVNR